MLFKGRQEVVRRGNLVLGDGRTERSKKTFVPQLGGKIRNVRYDVSHKAGAQ